MSEQVWCKGAGRGANYEGGCTFCNFVGKPTKHWVVRPHLDRRWVNGGRAAKSSEATRWGECPNCDYGIRPGDFVHESTQGDLWQWEHDNCSDNEPEWMQEEIPRCEAECDGYRCIKPTEHQGAHGTGAFSWTEEP